jgi:uncharacterized protein (TIGR04255 family)
MTDYLQVVSSRPTKYRRPPLVEAVQEFSFRPDSIQWSDEYWLEFARRIADDFPDVKDGSVTAVGFAPLVASSKKIPVKRFASRSGGKVVTAGPGILGISIRPASESGGYSGWLETLSLANELRATYASVVGSSAVNQITLRYINKLPVIPGSFRLKNYVSDSYGLLPPILLEEINPFSHTVTRVLSADEESITSETVHLSAGAGEEGPELVLKIDEIARALPDNELINTDALATNLHEAAHAVFHGVFNDSLRKSFEPDEPSLLIHR